jgi:hypothetical protein
MVLGIRLHSIFPIEVWYVSKLSTTAVCGDVSGGQPREDKVSSVLETFLRHHDDATLT